VLEEQFAELRRPAFDIAHRMLGSVSEAEDVLQEGFLRLYQARKGGASRRGRTCRRDQSESRDRPQRDHGNGGGIQLDDYFREADRLSEEWHANKM
jgi:Sigma-70 region 2